MKPLQVSKDVVPLGEFKVQASRVLRKLRTAQRPVVITQNGKPAAVLITPEEFDRLHERDRFLEAVREGLADSDAGRIIEDRVLTGELEAALGSLEQS